MKRIISSLLVMILLLGTLPLVCAAAEIKGYDSVTHVQQPGSGDFVSYYQYDNGTIVVYNGIVQGTTGTITGYKYGDSVTIGEGGPATLIGAHAHEFEWTVNRDGHFYRCKCGSKHNFQEHTMGSDGKCICGYTFMDNADLTVLWMRGIKLTPGFKKNVTEYKGKLLVNDLEETKISAFSFDGKATIELPEDLTLKKGTNTFEVKVTAEDGKTTKTYTVTVEKE